MEYIGIGLVAIICYTFWRNVNRVDVYFFIYWRLSFSAVFSFHNLSNNKLMLEYAVVRNVA